jgi:hypothetical protein
VGLSGVIYSYAGLELATAHDYALEHLVWYTPEFSVLWRPLTSGTLFAPEHWIWLAYFGAAWLAFAAPFRRSLSTELSAFLQETRGRAGKFAREARW